MNTKELISTVASKMNYPKSEIQFLLDRFSEICIDQLKADNTIELQYFGSLLVKKKEEKVTVNSEMNIKTIYPPKLVIRFLQDEVLKNKLNF